VKYRRQVLGHTVRVVDDFDNDIRLVGELGEAGVEKRAAMIIDELEAESRVATEQVISVPGGSSRASGTVRRPMDSGNAILPENVFGKPGCRCSEFEFCVDRPDCTRSSQQNASKDDHG
jgi:hypothetical protein